VCEGKPQVHAREPSMLKLRTSHLNLASFHRPYWCCLGRSSLYHL
jgi:hypothetical protein